MLNLGLLNFQNGSSIGCYLHKRSCTRMIDELLLDDVKPHTLFKLDAAVTRRGVLWRMRHGATLAALAFSLHGGNALLRQPRSAWRFPLVQGRPLLLLHFTCAFCFAVAVTVQKCYILRIADGDAPTARRSARTKALCPRVSARGAAVVDGHAAHRWIGRVALVFGVGAAGTALLLARHALYGSAMMFLPWSIIWLGSSALAWYHAAVTRNFALHAEFANFSASSALIFILGRVFIAALSPWVANERIYFAAAAGAAGITLVNFVSLALRWRGEGKKLRARRKLKGGIAAVMAQNRAAAARGSE